MGTIVMGPVAPLMTDVKIEQPNNDFLDRLESCDSMLRKIEARTALLAWTSSVVGLPISHISQVQNGAVLCYIVAVLCKSKLDITMVDFLAVDEAEYTVNYRILQRVASKGKVGGLNKDAKLRDWLRLARSRSDAWLFLDLLRKTFKEAGFADYKVKIEADATPPPPPLVSRKGRKREVTAKDVALMAGQWMERTSSNDSSHLIYREPSTAPFDIGNLVLNLADAWSEQATASTPDQGVFSGPLCGKTAVEPINASTRRAHAILRSFLQTDGSSMCSSSRATSADLSTAYSRSNSDASTISAKSVYSFGTSP